MQEYKPFKSGKVREIYDIGDSLIMVSLVDETKTKLTEVNSLGWWLPIAFPLSTTS